MKSNSQPKESKTLPVGRPRKRPGEAYKKRRCVTLPDDIVEKAKRIGDGSTSKGIRISISAHKDKLDTGEKNV